MSNSRCLPERISEKSVIQVKFAPVSDDNLPHPEGHNDHGTISESLSGLTILAWMRQVLPELSWSQCRKLLASRRVWVNGVLTVPEGRRLHTGDRVEVRTHSQRTPQAAQLTLHYLDADIVVVEKPPHVVTARRPEERRWPWAKRQLDPTLDELAGIAIAAREHPRRKSPHKPVTAPVQAPLWRIQRLDRPTSGLVVFARHHAAAEALIPQFAEHTAERRYLAIVRGRPAVGRIETRLVRDRGDGRRGSLPEGETNGQRAVTHILSVAPHGPWSLIQCQLETGRTHQIRIHLAELGYPVAGDPAYGADDEGAPREELPGAPRLALHATTLAFQHPQTGQWMSFTSPLPQDLTQWLDSQGQNSQRTTANR